MYCEKCNKGYIYALDEKGEEIVYTCDCLIKFKEKKFKDIVFSKSKLPKFIKNYSLDKDYIGDDINKNLKLVKEFIKNFEEYNDISLYFYSSQRGNQKTTIAQYIMRELLYKKFDCRFMLMGDFLTILENEKFKEEASNLKDELLVCDLLILDDCFDKQKNNMYKSGYQLSFIDKFLRNRLEILNKSTIFTSNYSINEIESETFGINIPALLKRNIQLYKYELEFKDNIEEFKCKSNSFAINNFKSRLHNSISKKNIRVIKDSK